MNKPEKIVCAAVKVEIIDNYGRSHHDMFISTDHMDAYMEDCLAEFINEIESTGRKVQEQKITQGFVTNFKEKWGYPRFVDAKEAMKIAISAGQYPDCDRKIRSLKLELSSIEEIERKNKEAGVFGPHTYVPDREVLEKQILKFEEILQITELKPEDLY